MATSFPGSLSPAAGRTRRRWPRALGVALAVSAVLHLAWSLWPVQMPAAPQTEPLTATLTEMPAPPVAAPAPPPPPARRAPRRKPSAPVLAQSSEAAPAVDVEAPPAPPAPVAPARAAPLAEPAPVAAAPVDTPAPPAPPAAPAKVLPPRLDLAYKVFLGTQGFLIGDATYRFEHDGPDYRISTVGQARGLAALIVHGQGRIESRGRITPDGLKPEEFAIQRGGPDKREVARFDWNANTVTLHDDKREPLDALTFDPLTVLWQTYFTPPEGNEYRFSVATTRKVYRYTVTREGEERLAWRGGEVDTVRWHRVNQENKTEAWFWLAPSMHFIPIKIRVTQTSRGTLEAMLDAIRTDATPEAAASEPPLEAESVTRTDPFAAHGQ